MDGIQVQRVINKTPREFFNISVHAGIDTEFNGPKEFIRNFIFEDTPTPQTTVITSTEPYTDVAATSQPPQSTLCNGVRCHPDADCVQYSKISQCECRDNFVGNGTDCRDTCSVFQYNCPYIRCMQEYGWCDCSGSIKQEERKYCKWYGCEDEGEFNLKCFNSKVINILFANYGSAEEEVIRCKNGSRLKCTALTSLNIVKRLCQGKHECMLLPSSNVFGDPCVGVHKYLEVHYQCNRAPSTYLDATVIGWRNNITEPNIAPTDCRSSLGLVSGKSPIYQVFTISSNMPRSVRIRKVTLMVKAIENHIPKYHIQVSSLYDVGYCGNSSALYESFPPNIRVSVGCNLFPGVFITVIGLTSRDTINICHIEVEEFDGSIHQCHALGDSASGLYSLSINKNKQELPQIMLSSPSDIRGKRRRRGIDMLPHQSKCLVLGPFYYGGDIFLALPKRTITVTRVKISMAMETLVPMYVYVLVRGETRTCQRNSVSLKQVFYCEDFFQLYNSVGRYITIQFLPTVSFRFLSICDIEIQGRHPSPEVDKAKFRKGMSMCFKESFGDDNFKGEYMANTTQGNEYFRAPCKYNKDRYVTRYCRKNSYDNATWDVPNLEACLPKIPPITLAMTTLPVLRDTTTLKLNQLNKSNICENGQATNCSSAKETSTNLNQILNDSVVIVPEDVKITSTVVSNIVKNVKKEELPEVAENVVATVSSIMETEKATLVTAEAGDNSATSLLKDLDKLALKIGDSLPDGRLSTRQVTSKNIGLQVAKVPKKQDIVVEAEIIKGIMVDFPKDFTPFSINIFASAVIPNTTFNSSDEIIISYAYQDGSLFVDTDAKGVLSANNLVQSVVLSISLGDNNISSLANPIIFRFKKQRFMKRASKCVFWEFGKGKESGKWSTSGCRIINETSDGNVTCECDHLTSFAILLDVYQTGNNPKALSYITYIGSGISLIGLILTIIVHGSYRELRKKLPSKILICLSASFVLLLVIFLAGVAEADSRLLCQVIAGLLHYFILTLWAWMGVTAINLYRFIVLVFRSNDTRFYIISSIFAWGAPLIIVVVTGAVEPSSLGNDEICFVRGNSFYFGVLLPIVLVLLSNFIFFIIIVVKLCRRSPPTDKVAAANQKDIVSQCRIAFSVSVLLGLTWLFAVFAVEKAEFVFQLLFCIFNALQGFLIFGLYTLRNPTVLEKLKHYCCKSDDGRSVSSSSAQLNSKETNTTDEYPMRGYPNRGMDSIG